MTRGAAHVTVLLDEAVRAMPLLSPEEIAAWHAQNGQRLLAA